MTTDSDESDSRPTSTTSQSVDDEMNIYEVGVARSVEAITPPAGDQQRRSSVRKCYSLATTRHPSVEDRSVQVQQLHRIVHVSLSLCSMLLVYVIQLSRVI